MTTNQAPQVWQPYTETMRITIMRTVAIALVVGTVIATTSHGRIPWWAAVLLSLWPSVGGHWIELWFLNWLRPQLPASRTVHVAARLALWLVGGVVLALLIRGTSRMMMPQSPIRLPMLVGAIGFVGVELIAHLGLQLRGRPSFYNARG